VFRLSPAFREEPAQQERPVDGVQPRHVRRHLETEAVNFSSGSRSASEASENLGYEIYIAQP
jgi:hypothetical protein